MDRLYLDQYHSRCSWIDLRDIDRRPGRQLAGILRDQEAQGSTAHKASAARANKKPTGSSGARPAFPGWGPRPQNQLAITHRSTEQLFNLSISSHLTSDNVHRLSPQSIEIFCLRRAKKRKHGLEKSRHHRIQQHTFGQTQIRRRLC